MAEEKVNCWEYWQCSRGPATADPLEEDVCPAANDTALEGVNGGIRGGRICWAVAGTFCGGKVQGSFAEKRNSCMECEFFQKVRMEQGADNLETKFLSFVSRDGKTPLFRHEAYRLIRAGERFIRQGEVGSEAYIIQKGSCLVIVEKEGELYPVDHYGEGDIVGGMGLLTEEPHLAHVEAETDLQVWVLTRADFDRISERDPDLLGFLTEFVVNRLDARRITAYRTIGKYVATDIIGRGAFSIVYKGVHASLNLPVAIKMMKHTFALDPAFLEGFHREAKTIAALNHENIVRIYDIEERFCTVFIIMELLEGESLRVLLRRLKRLPTTLAVEILLQVCQGLRFAHGKGVVHRDINPDNLFLLAGNRVKILDFGLACQEGTEDINLSGTARYMSPEQIEGDAVDGRTDIYGVGLTGYEILTGEHPFPAETTKTVLDRHLEEDVPDPGEAAPELPDGLRAFLRKAGSRDPARRYPNAEAALEDLHAVARELRLTDRHPKAEKQLLASLVMMHRERHRKELTRLLEEFCSQAEKLGVVVKISDLHSL